MKKLIQKIALSLATISSLCLLAVPAAVGAQPAPTPAPAAQSPKTAICEGVGFTGNNGNCNDVNAANTNVQSIVKTVIDILSIAVGVVSVIMIIIGGFKYITSSGDGNNVSSAKNTILYAIIGLVVVALAQIIVRFVLTRVAV